MTERDNLVELQRKDRDKKFFVGPVTKRTPETAIEVATFALLREWFPTRIPVDIDSWENIAQMDARVVVKALEDQGFLSLDNKEEK